MNKKFYITTPVYYVNDIPHIGHAYTTIGADVLARYKRSKGFDVFFLTGTDEHGQKVAQAAEREKKNPKEFVDSIVDSYKKTWDLLQITNDDFIRTTDDRHIKAVQGIFKTLLEKGLIYKGIYEGWYCVSCETFVLQGQTLDANDLPFRVCPDCHGETKILKEESYFFKLSAFEDKLLVLYAENPDFVQPKSRLNEVVIFVKQGLKDLSITRTTFNWGVPVPNDSKHVIYVWFDALINYISAIGYPDGEKFKKYWPADIHLMGKEIVRFHAVIWPAILMAIEFPLPKKVFGHGWWTVEGRKMSKSLGNTVDPIKMSENYGVDAFRYFVLREVSFGNDGDFSTQSFINRYNADLANDLGNLLSRTLTMIEKYFEGKVPDVKDNAFDPLSRDIINLIKQTPSKFDECIDRLAFSEALECVWILISFANAYIEQEAPWALEKKGETEKLSCVLFNLYEALRIVAALVSPFMPGSSLEIWKQLNFPQEPQSISLNPFGMKIAGIVIKKGQPLFPRLNK